MVAHRVFKGCIQDANSFNDFSNHLMLLRFSKNYSSCKIQKSNTLPVCDCYSTLKTPFDTSLKYSSPTHTWQLRN